jgi:hypothetical protein
VQKHFILKFTPSVQKTRIPNWDPDLSKKFADKYNSRCWGDFQGKQVNVLREINVGVFKTRHYRFHFPEDPESCFATLGYYYFIACANSKKRSCTCDIWKNGCSCGQFQFEENNENEY